MKLNKLILKSHNKSTKEIVVSIWEKDKWNPNYEEAIKHLVFRSRKMIGKLPNITEVTQLDTLSWLKDEIQVIKDWAKYSLDSIQYNYDKDGREIRSIDIVFAY